MLPSNIEQLGVKVFKNLEEGLEGVDIIMVLRIQKEGKRDMSVDEFLAGNNFRKGTKLN